MGTSAEGQDFVSRGGVKLAHALDTFGLEVEGLVCADLGCSTGGFTDCLLQRGALRVHSVDTAYGQLAWRLRQDPRVVVHERTNALHMEPPEVVDLVVLDLGWTRQERAIPAALRWLGENGRIVSLIKPHYEIDRATLEALGSQGVLPDEEARRIAEQTMAGLAGQGVRVVDSVCSPIRGGKGGRGNLEWLVLLEKDGSEAK